MWKVEEVGVEGNESVGREKAESGDGGAGGKGGLILKPYCVSLDINQILEKQR